MNGKLLAVAFLSLLLLAALFQNRYDSTIDYFGNRSTFVNLPSGKALRILSFGYQNLAADLLFIWSIQFYSNLRLTNRFDFLERIYDTISDISPQFKEPYIVGSLIMVYEAQDVPMALRLLEKGSRLNPGEWLFDHDAGYYCHKFLKDYGQANRFYQRAAAKPGAPSFLKRQSAHMVYLQDDPRAAYRMWFEIYSQTDDKLEKAAAFNHLYQIKAEIDLSFLNPLILRFREVYRRNPASLQELAIRGLTAEIPKDFSQNDYQYDPLTGAVKAQRVFRWKRR